MSETYRAKRERWQRLLEALPENLRSHVSLRNVEAVAGLCPRAQARLGEAISAGLKRLPRAIEQLRADPNTPVSELLNPPTVSTHSEVENSVELHQELTDLIRSCYPDMPHLSAEALAASDAMQIVRDVAQTFHRVFSSPHLKADFVLVVLYALLLRTMERFDEIIADMPACQKTLMQLNLPVISPTISNEWRTQHAQTNR